MRWQPPAGMDEYLKPTELCDSDHAEVKNKAQEITKDAETPKEAAIRIFDFVRDQILFGFNRLNAKASETLKGGIGFCITKSNLQAALLRATGIPARYHQVLLNRESLKDLVPNFFYRKVPERIPWHTWCECHLSGKWVDCEPLFDKGLYNAACKKNIIRKEQLPNIDWDGEHNLIMVAAFILEDKGPFHDLDDVFEKAYEETELPPVIS
jgi:hypothetical protein